MKILHFVSLQKAKFCSNLFREITNSTRKESFFCAINCYSYNNYGLRGIFFCKIIFVTFCIVFALFSHYFAKCEFFLHFLRESFWALTVDQTNRQVELLPTSIFFQLFISNMLVLIIFIIEQIWTKC